MTTCSKWCWKPSLRLLAPVLIACMVPGWLQAGESSIPASAFGAELLNGDWQFELTGEFCVLRQTISGYGEARFLRQGDAPPVFELLALRPHFNGETIDLRSRAPDWHPAYPEESRLAQVVGADNGDLHLDGAVVLQMLLQLREGRQLLFDQTLTQLLPTRVVVALSPLHFRSVYAKLADCGAQQAAYIRQSRLAALKQRAESKVWFDVDSARLLPDSQARLDEVVRLLREELAESEPWVRRIEIAGHTDSTGTRDHNEGLSRRRAQAVADYLAAAGINGEWIEVHYHADRRPVASNDDARGRQQNRRTQVRLLGADARQLADLSHPRAIQVN